MAEPLLTNADALEERLSRPNAADIEAVAQLGPRLLILGASGKMGPSLALRARRASANLEIIAVARFSEPGSRDFFKAHGIDTIQADLLDPSALPDAPNVLFLAGRKFGTQGAEYLTWAMNALVPALVAERFRDSRIVAFSSGNVYPLQPLALGGANEQTPTDPLGEYAQSVRARERMFELAAARHGTPSCLLRLNYAIDLRYGVLADIGRKVFNGQPVDVSMGAANVIWQGDANSVALRAFPLCAAPPAVLNLTGPETLSVRRAAQRFAEIFSVDAIITGQEAPTALLNDASRCHRLFGYPEVSLDQLLLWTAEWIRSGGASLGKPTHFEARDGKY